MKKYFASLLLLLLMVFASHTAVAQAPKATAQEAIAALLDRIGGQGAADRFVTVIDPSLAENGKDVFIITSQDGKPCIKGNNQLAVATGINWYLNHHAHINLTWNNLTTDLVSATLPAPAGEEKHICNTKYRYNFNTCTFSYSMAFWTWDRWQKEIDWMALHGINTPLNLVGLDVVTRNFLKELKVSDQDINNYIAGPGFIAWFAMNNLEGWGSTINATDVTMNGNPDWWYTRQENLCRNMLQRMRELGMQPVIPGFSGQVPNSIVNYTIDGFNKNDVVDNGTWAGGYTRPDILKPNTDSYKTFAEIWYRHLEAVMGVSELYSMDPFHEGALPGGVTNATCYPNIMAELDKYFGTITGDTKTKYNVDNQPGWIIQYWQNVPQSGAFSAMASYGDRFIGLDLFADNIYADNAAKWQTEYFSGRPYIYCMLHNFGGRSGMHGRLETTMDGYFKALAKNNNMQGVGATPEGTETNPILYDMLFELPWMDPKTRPTADEWLADYTHSRYGVDAATAPKALEALKNLKKSVWDCKVNQQGTSEAVILARPNWTVGSVSSWSTSAIYWNTQDVLVAADQLISVEDLITSRDGIKNYNYDLIDVIRQAMVDYAAELLPLIKKAYDSKNQAEYERLYNIYLKLMLDLDTMLSYDENFKLERWTSLARNIANEANSTTTNDRNWLEWNARTQVTVWSKGNTDLHDYSNRCWSGLIKDFHYERWKYFFENNGNAPSGGWFTGFEYPWTVNFTDYDYSTVNIPQDVTATEKAVETFGNYFGRVLGTNGNNYIFPMGITRNATNSAVIPEINRGQTAALPLSIGKNVTITEVKIDLNGDGSFGLGETLTANEMNVEIPVDATIGKTTATVTFSDGTSITFNLAIVEEITDARTVTVATANNEQGTVAIEGTNELSITNTEAVKIIATAKTGYNFSHWTNAGGDTISNNNPYIYYGKEGATFTANFIQDKWGVVACNGTLSGDIATSKQFIHNLTFAYYNRAAETIFETTDTPTEIFNTIPKIINVPRGASFNVAYDNGSNDGLKYCYFRAFIDLNADGDFADEGELLKEVGTNGAQNTAVCSNNINVLLPYDAPLGITHMRLRFDGAWDNGNNPSGRGAKDPSIRPVYEILINVIEGSDKAAHIKVKSNNDEWGTAECWTDETPGWTASNEWNVSANIPMHIKAVPASDEVEFLGWYDQYDRLLTTELEYARLAIEDATYTARFRKFLEIDGWQLEYRTEPGKSVETKLDNGVTPQDGKTYYIYADTRPDNAGAYVPRYLYNNNGKLSTNTAKGDNNYLWTCSVDGENYTFRNVGNPQKYLKHKGVQDAPYNFKLATGDTKHEGITIYSIDASRYLVTKDDGTDFDQSSRTHDQSTEDFCTDYVFIEVTPTDNVILTQVRKSGNGDLVIPETVNIIGVPCTIVGFDNNLFNNNKELTSITLPKTMEFVSIKEMLKGSMTGTITPETGKENTPAHYVTFTLEETLVASEGFEVTVKGTSDGSSFNQWGSGLFATSDYPLGAYYDNGFQFYLAKDGTIKLLVAANNGNTDNSKTLDNANCKVIPGVPFTATIRYENNTVTITVDNGNGQIGTYTKSGCTISNISQFSAAIPLGISLEVNVVSLSSNENNPFSGCSNLDAIAIDGDCERYYVNDADGGLYNKSDKLVSLPEGKEKGAARRELGALIEMMQTLTEQVATYDPTGKANKITLQTTDSNSANYLWSNAPDNQEGTINALVDGITGQTANDKFFHSNWHSVSTTAGYHYLEVDLGENNKYKQFKFKYTNRNDGSNHPDNITVKGSNKKDNYLNPTSLYTVNSGLPQNQGGSWESGTFTCDSLYRYIHFKIGAENTFWHMDEFELYHMTSTADVFPMFEVGITNEQAAAGYDALVDAINVYDNGTTAEQMTTAKATLQTAYDTLKALLDAAIPVTLTTDENNPVLYKIVINREGNGDPDSKVLQYDEASKMVAVSNVAADKSYQAWYFMTGNDGFTIHPYNGYGKVLGANNTGNGAGKVSAAEKSEHTAAGEWIFRKEGNYYNIKTTTGAYFSNFGGTGNKMGFWNGDGTESNTQNDGGSKFKFIEVEFSNGNPRYYQLSDFKATLAINGANAMTGTAPGCYTTGGDEYHDAYTTAETIIAAGNTQAADDCYTAYTALRTTVEGLGEIIMPEDGKFYRIRNFFAKDKLTHYLATNSDAEIAFPTEATDNSTLWICKKVDNYYKFINALGTAELGWKKTDEEGTLYTFTPGIERGALSFAHYATTEVYNGSIIGNGTKQTVTPTATLPTWDIWKLEMEATSDGSSFNAQWGTQLLKGNDNIELLYIANGTSQSKGEHIRSPFSGLGNDYFLELTENKCTTFKVTIECNGNNELIISVTNNEGVTKSSDKIAYSNTFNNFTIETPAGIDVTRLKITKYAFDNNLAFNPWNNDKLNGNWNSQQLDWLSTDWYLEPADNADIIFSRAIAKGNEWNTLYLPYSVTIPNDITAYTATITDVNNTEKVITLTSIDNGIIPARTAVLLHRGTSAARINYNFIYTADEGEQINDNIFKGCVITSYITEENARFYLLLKSTKGEAFYWVATEYDENGVLSNSGTHIKCDANKAYLTLPDNKANSAVYRFMIDGTTSIDEIDSDENAVKNIYDLKGRKLTKVIEPGIYIINGEKVLVK